MNLRIGSSALAGICISLPIKMHSILSAQSNCGFLTFYQGHLDDRDLKHELQMILVYGSKLPIANMLVFISERGATANSSSSQEQLPIRTVVIAGNYVPSTATRPATWSAAGR